ncbi:MAG: hypothetical protein QGG74_05380, partial [Phycisphaerales bacterium]|nr:hypothetical protein [Phycisphaerales bacterium]
SEAISLIGGLGGETAAMLLGQLDDSGLPPEETYEPPTRPEPVLPRGDAGDSTDPALAALADTLVSIIGMPKSEQIPALRPLVDCDAPSQPCAMMDLDADMNKTVADFGAAIAASPLANDPTTAKVAAAVQAMAGGDEGEARQTTLEGVQQTAPNAATITCSATVPELGTSITLVTPAEKTANGWKLVGLPMPHGAPLPTLDQARTVLLAIKGITAKIQSGEIADAAALQQALTALAPR